MTATVFDPTTAYNADWRFFQPQIMADCRVERRSEGNTLSSWCNAKAHRLTINTPNFVTIATALQATADDTIWALWPLPQSGEAPDPEYDCRTPPEVHDLLVFNQNEDDEEKWVVQTVTQTRMGPKWHFTATKAPN